jgi:hypothetical protein
VGLAIFLHQQEAEGRKNLAVEVARKDSLLNGVENGVVGTDVTADYVSGTTSHMREDVVVNSCGEGNWVKVDWRWAGRARPRTVKRGGREQATRTGSGRSLGDGSGEL